MDKWKIEDKMDVTLLFFKQIDRINMIMSERLFDIMQLARSVDALEASTYFLKNRDKKKKVYVKKSESVVSKIKAKQISRDDMYELGREKLSDIMQLLDDTGMLTKKRYDGQM